MKIQNLTIEGFRSLKHVEWQPGDLNVLIGPNGSGKSNLLRLMELISASVKGKLEDTILKSGGIDSLLWDGRSDQIRFDLLIDSTTDIYSYAAQLTRIPYRNDYTVASEKFTISFSKPTIELLKEIRIKRQNNEVEIGLERTVHEEVFSPADLSIKETLASKFSGLSALGLATSMKNSAARTLLVDNMIGFSKFLEGLTIYHDVQVHADAPMRQSVIARLEKQVAPNGQNLISVLHTLYTGNRDFKQDINAGMLAAFGEDFDELVFPPAADQRIQMRVRWKTLQREVSAADLSDGTLRFLFLLTVLANPEPPALIAIDEPETGLHPSMLPIVAEYAVEASRRTQVILSTHSAEFLDGFTDVRPTTTVFKWENGETSLSVIDGERLAYWLKNYTLGNLQRTGELEQMV